MIDSAIGNYGSRGQLRCEFALILLIFFIDGGAAAPHVNESHYLTKATHYWNADYCPGDLFLDSADPHLAFYWSLGWLTKFLPLTAVAWIGRMAAWTLLAAGWQRLSTAVVTAHWASVLSAALWVTLLRDGNRNFAGEWVVGARTDGTRVLLGRGGSDGGSHRLVSVDALDGTTAWERAGAGLLNALQSVDGNPVLLGRTLHGLG